VIGFYRLDTVVQSTVSKHGRKGLISINQKCCEDLTSMGAHKDENQEGSLAFPGKGKMCAVL